MLNLKLIYKDRRGGIFILEENRKELGTILTTRKGFARGGCIHKLSGEYSVVLRGLIEYHIRGKKTKIRKEGDVVMIPKNAAHYLVSLEDSLLLEWGPSRGERETKDKKYKEIVDHLNLAKK